MAPADPNVTPAVIDAFVKRVIGWSQLLQQCTDASLQRAHDQYAAGEVDYAAYSDALQQKLVVVQQCVAMIDAAEDYLLKMAESELGPIQRATDRLAAATKALANLQNAVVVVSELVTAAAALATAITEPSAATIAAAGTAVYTVANQIIGDGKATGNAPVAATTET